MYQLDWYRWANSDQSSNIIMKCAYKAVKLKNHWNINFNHISILMQSWVFSQKASEKAIISPPICKIIYVALLDGIITKVFSPKASDKVYYKMSNYSVSFIFRGRKYLHIVWAKYNDKILYITVEGVEYNCSLNSEVWCGCGGRGVGRSNRVWVYLK